MGSHGDQSWSNERYVSTRKETIEDRDGDGPPCCSCSEYRECEYPSSRTHEYHHVEVTQRVGEEVGRDPTKDGSGIEDCKEVKGDIR
jgi:hypothetical protein